MIGKEKVKMVYSYFGKNLIAGSILIITTILINPIAYAVLSDCTSPTVKISTMTTASDGKFRITGTMTLNSDLLCGLILANGQFMFTCGDPLPKGNFDLTVPLDSQGQITLFGFSAGLVPFQRTFSPSSPIPLVAGSWAGKYICFNVSPDGSKLTKEGSLCTWDGSPPGTIDSTGKVADSKSIVVYHNDVGFVFSPYSSVDVPIVNDAFNEVLTSDATNWVDGIFISPTTAFGVAKLHISKPSTTDYNIYWDASKSESIKPISGKWSGKTSDGGSVCFYVASDGSRLTKGGCVVLSNIILPCAFGVFPPNNSSPTCPAGSIDLQVVSNFFRAFGVVNGQFTSPRNASGTAADRISGKWVSWSASPGY